MEMNGQKLFDKKKRKELFVFVAYLRLKSKENILFHLTFYSNQLILCFKDSRMFVAWCFELPKYHLCISVISTIILNALGLFDGDVIIIIIIL